MKTLNTSHQLPSSWNIKGGFLSFLRHNIAARALTLVIASSWVPSLANTPQNGDIRLDQQWQLMNNWAFSISPIPWDFQILPGTLQPSLNSQESEEDLCSPNDDMRTQILNCYLSELDSGEFDPDQLDDMLTSVGDDHILALYGDLQIIMGKWDLITAIPSSIGGEESKKWDREESIYTPEDMFTLLQVFMELGYEGFDEAGRAVHDADKKKLLAKYPTLTIPDSSLTLKGTIDE